MLKKASSRGPVASAVATGRSRRSEAQLSGNVRHSLVSIVKMVLLPSTRKVGTSTNIKAFKIMPLMFFWGGMLFTYFLAMSVIVMAMVKLLGLTVFQNLLMITKMVHVFIASQYCMLMLMLMLSS